MDLIRVLIVDDHALVRRSLQTLLNKAPDMVVVGAAANGVDALEQAAALKPDLILMDISLPVMDGYAATRRIRETNKSTPIIGLSAHAMSGHEESAKEAGCNDYLTKPLNDELLFNMLTKYLG